MKEKTTAKDMWESAGYAGLALGLVSAAYMIINSYLGALIWSTTFISLGKVLGDNYDKFNNNITKCVVIGIIGVLLILLIVYLIKRYKN